MNKLKEFRKIRMQFSFLRIMLNHLLPRVSVKTYMTGLIRMIFLLPLINMAQQVWNSSQKVPIAGSKEFSWWVTEMKIEALLV